MLAADLKAGTAIKVIQRKNFTDARKENALNPPLEHERKLFPFNGAGRFGTNVVNHSVDATNLRDYTGGDACE